ncbi:MAG: glycosyltransferase [Acidimicrobiales bacterium]
MTAITSTRALRVVQLNHADLQGGGAAIAGFRLHRALHESGRVQSSMCVGGKASTDEDVRELAHPALARKLIRKVGRELGLNELDGIGAYRLGDASDVRAADVLHFHAIHGGWFSYPAMVRLTAATPSVMTLHDMWAFTGHCSYSLECERWRSGCGSCPHPEMFPAIRRDATRIEWRVKDAVWARSKLVIVSPSRWLAGLATDSTLGRFPVRIIPLGIDTATFAPRAPDVARHALGIPEDRTVILFAAAFLGGTTAGSLTGSRKGADLLMEVLRRVPPEQRATCTLLLMGSSSPDMTALLRALDYDVVDVGYVASDELKSIVYSAADVFVCPTKADNSPLVIIESIACGTPVLSFAVGGVAELVRPGVTGALAPAGDVGAMTRRLVELLDDPGALAAMRSTCRAVAEREHANAIAVERHIALYEELADR